MAEGYLVSRDFVDKNSLQEYSQNHTYPQHGEEVDEDRLKVLREAGVLYPEKTNPKEMTISDLKKKLDENQVKYEEKAKKADLLKLYAEEVLEPKEGAK